VQVYTYAISPYDDWHRQAWAGATVLIGAVLLFSLLARLATRRLEECTGRERIAMPELRIGRP